MEIKKIWKVVFDPEESYIQQAKNLALIYQTTREGDKPIAIEISPDELDNIFFRGQLQEQGLPASPRINEKGICLCATVAQNVAELRREITRLKTKTP